MTWVGRGGGDGSGCEKEAPEKGIYAYLQLIHIVEQKLTQYCKAFILKFLEVSSIAVKLIFPFKISVFASCILKLLSGTCTFSIVMS